MLFAVLAFITAEAPIAKDFETLKEVHSAKVVTNSETPKQTIIHLKDWHWVSAEEMKITVREDGYTDEEFDRLYKYFIKSVRKVQSEQEAVLRMLIKKHGIKSVYKEGMTIEDAAVDAAVQDVAWSKENRKKNEFDSLRLSLGIAGKLKADGLLKDVKPCESKKLFEACNPFDENGKRRDVAIADEKARNRFIVQTIVKGGEKFSVVILGGSHNLSDHVPKGVRLIEVTLKAYHEAVPK